MELEVPCINDIESIGRDITWRSNHLEGTLLELCVLLQAFCILVDTEWQL